MPPGNLRRQRKKWPGGAWGRHDRSAEDTTRLLLPLWCGAQGFNGFKLEHQTDAWKNPRKIMGCLSLTLWWFNIAMERSTIFNGKTHYTSPFSIDMLNYQRVSTGASDFAGPCTVSHRYLDQLWAISGWWWLEPCFFFFLITFPSYWECHHPNISEVHHFSEGVGQPPSRYGPFWENEEVHQGRSTREFSAPFVHPYGFKML